MAKEKKVPPISKELRQRVQAREERYLYTIGTDKRHDLLFAPYGISFPVFRTLAYLVLYPEGVAPSQIADKLQILRQTMTNIVDSLEKQGLVEREADPHDRRRIQVRLLPAGLELGEKLIRIEEDYAERIHRYITDEERATFYCLEKKMYEAKMSALNDILAEREVQQ